MTHTTSGWPVVSREERGHSAGELVQKIIALQDVVVFSGHKKNDNGAVRGGREKGQQIFSLQNLRKKKMPALSRLETHTQLLGMASGVGTCASVQKKLVQ